MARGRKNHWSRAAVESNVTPTEDVGGSKRKICRPEYREEYLEANFIVLVGQDEDEVPYPTSLSTLINTIRTGRVSKAPSKEEVRTRKSLQCLWECPVESQVASFFERIVFTDKMEGATNFLQRHERVWMKKVHVPKNPESDTEVSTPVPDMLYGYNHRHSTPFSKEELQTQTRVLPGGLAAANSLHLRFPFLVVEVKGDEPFWQAVNQCLGGASTCVRIMNRLNEKIQLLSAGQATPLETAAFSVAVNNLIAGVYVTWFHNNKYLTREVERFSLHSRKPDDFIQFYHVIQNILDWGQGKRLDEIKAGLAELTEFPRPREGLVTVAEDRGNAPPSAGTRSRLDTYPDEHRTPLPVAAKRKRNTTETPQIPEDSTFQDQSTGLSTIRRSARIRHLPRPVYYEPATRSVAKRRRRRTQMETFGGPSNYVTPIPARSVLTKRRAQKEALWDQDISPIPEASTSTSVAVDRPTAPRRSPLRPVLGMDQENRSPAKDATPCTARPWNFPNLLAAASPGIGLPHRDWAW